MQRLAELLTAPRRHYKRTDKFMRALEKNMLIVSTVEATGKQHALKKYDQFALNITAAGQKIKKNPDKKNKKTREIK